MFYFTVYPELKANVLNRVNPQKEPGKELNPVKLLKPRRMGFRWEGLRVICETYQTAHERPTCAEQSQKAPITNNHLQK